MWPPQSTNDFSKKERSAPIDMPNRQADLTGNYVDPHHVVFSPKSTDPANLGINMCINILEGDNSPRVKDHPLDNVTQHLQTLNLRVSLARHLDSRLHSVRVSWRSSGVTIVRRRIVVLPISLDQFVVS